jgi:uncharacterized damage-inducible protein DinB
MTDTRSRPEGYAAVPRSGSTRWVSGSRRQLLVDCDARRVRDEEDIMRFIAVFALVGAMGMTDVRGALAQQAPDGAATMASTVGKWWQMINNSFVEAADAMPEEKYSFKPSGGAFDNVRTFAEQVKHVACSNEAFALEVQHKDPPPDCEKGGPNPAKTKAELLQYLQQSFGQVNDIITQMTTANALEAAGGRYGGTSTRLGLATLAVWHASDHYGQLVIYLRMNGMVPPASR